MGKQQVINKLDLNILRSYASECAHLLVLSNTIASFVKYMMMSNRQTD